MAHIAPNSTSSSNNCFVIKQRRCSCTIRSMLMAQTADWPGFNWALWPIRANASVPCKAGILCSPDVYKIVHSCPQDTAIMNLVAFTPTGEQEPMSDLMEKVINDVHKLPDEEQDAL